MARTPLPVTVALPNSQITVVSTAVDPTNGHTIAANSLTKRMLMRVNNTTVSAKIITLKAGAYPPASRSGIGDLPLSIPASTVQWVPIESARFVQADGSISIDLAAAMTGTIEVLSAARGAS